jgi:hypothetical protein
MSKIIWNLENMKDLEFVAAINNSIYDGIPMENAEEVEVWLYKLLQDAGRVME